jgi:hypothetical protein
MLGKGLELQVRLLENTAPLVGMSRAEYKETSGAEQKGTNN